MPSSTAPSTSGAETQLREIRGQGVVDPSVETAGSFVDRGVGEFRGQTEFRGQSFVDRVSWTRVCESFVDRRDAHFVGTDEC